MFLSSLRTIIHTEIKSKRKLNKFLDLCKMLPLIDIDNRNLLKLNQ